MSAAPEKISILHDDYHARHIGRTSDGRQFFLTSAFEPAMGESPGREFVALFLFDNDGTLIEDRIDELGTRQAWVGWPATRKQSVRQHNRRRHQATPCRAWRRHFWRHRNSPVWDGTIWHDFRISTHRARGR